MTCSAHAILSWTWHGEVVIGNNQGVILLHTLVTGSRRLKYQSHVAFFEVTTCIEKIGLFLFESRGPLSYVLKLKQTQAPPR